MQMCNWANSLVNRLEYRYHSSMVILWELLILNTIRSILMLNYQIMTWRLEKSELKRGKILQRENRTILRMFVKRQKLVQLLISGEFRIGQQAILTRKICVVISIPTTTKRRHGMAA